jgi:hypothetical protein
MHYEFTQQENREWELLESSISQNVSLYMRGMMKSLYFTTADELKLSTYE